MSARVEHDESTVTLRDCGMCGFALPADLPPNLTVPLSDTVTLRFNLCVHCAERMASGYQWMAKRKLRRALLKRMAAITRELRA